MGDGRSLASRRRAARILRFRIVRNYEHLCVLAWKWHAQSARFRGGTCGVLGAPPLCGWRAWCVTGWGNDHYRRTNLSFCVGAGRSEHGRADGCRPPHDAILEFHMQTGQHGARLPMTARASNRNDRCAPADRPSPSRTNHRNTDGRSQASVLWVAVCGGVVGASEGATLGGGQADRRARRLGDLARSHGQRWQSARAC